jgi:hypothetical protein
MSVRPVASLLALLFVCAAGARSARADDIPQFQLIANAASDVQASVDDLKAALLADGGPQARSIFSLLNNLDARAHGIEVHAFIGLGSNDDPDIGALMQIVMMEAARSAQEDLRAIMADVKAINHAKARQRDLLDRLRHDDAVGSATDRLVSNADALLDFFGLCVFCDE